MARSVKNVTDPSYLARQALAFGAVAAGNGGVTAKFVAHAELQLYGVNTTMITQGTSTYTVGGTATLSSQQLSLIVVQNTASAGQTAQLSTTTFGPFTAGGLFVTTGVGTGQAFGNNQFQINPTAGTAGYGGVRVNRGSLMYFVSGTDATAVTSVTIDYQIGTGAGLLQ